MILNLAHEFEESLKNSKVTMLNQQKYQHNRNSVYVVIFHIKKCLSDNSYMTFYKFLRKVENSLELPLTSINTF